MASEEDLQLWRQTWRDGFAVQWTVPQLQAILAFVVRNDPNLIQHHATVPLALQGMEAPCRGGDVISITGMAAGFVNVEEVETYFCATCSHAMSLVGRPSVVRFLQIYDSLPRSEMLRLVEEEVRSSLAHKENECEPKKN